MTGHRFDVRGVCVWCSTKERPVTRELVDDRRAPPWCEKRPEHLDDEPRDGANHYTGY